jgi:transposase
VSATADVQRRAAELVGKGATRKEAAAAVGVCERTVRDWLKRPELAESRARRPTHLTGSRRA